MATRWTSGTPLRNRLSHLPDGVEHRLQPGFEAAAGQVGIGDPWGRDHVRGGRELRNARAGDSPARCTSTAHHMPQLWRRSTALTVN